MQCKQHKEVKSGVTELTQPLRMGAFQRKCKIHPIVTKHNDLNMMNKHDKTHFWVFRHRTPCINYTCMHKRRNLELFRGKTEALLKLCIHDTHTLIFKSEARANLYTLYDTSTVLLWFGGPALQQGKHSGRKKKVSLAPFSNSCHRAKTLWNG